jgi:lipopolysaccharide export system permease protein
MRTRVDRYLVLMYLRVVLILFASLAGLLMVIQIFTHLDDFMAYFKATGGIAIGLGAYFGPNLLSIFDRLSPLLSLTAMMFVVHWLYRTNELTALLAAGISKRRLMRPLLFGAVGLCLVSVVNRELVMPRFGSLLTRRPQELSGNLPRPMRPVHDAEQGFFLSGRHLLPVQQLVVAPVVRLVGPLAELGSTIRAEVAIHSPRQAERPAGFRLVGIQTPVDLPTQASLWEGERPLLLTAADTPWLSPGECFLVSPLDYELLKAGNEWRHYSSLWQLRRRLIDHHELLGDDLRVSLHARLLKPISDLTLVLLGLPLVLRRADRHIFWVAGIGGFLAASFSGLSFGLQLLGAASPWLSPELAAWIPLLVFFPWAWMQTQIALDS